MTHYVVEFQTRLGDYEFRSFELFTATSRKGFDRQVEYFMRCNYDQNPRIDGDWWYYNVDEVAVRIVNVVEVPVSEAIILSQYI